jgi:hypothetical protein
LFISSSGIVAPSLMTPSGELDVVISGSVDDCFRSFCSEKRKKFIRSKTEIKLIMSF